MRGVEDAVTSSEVAAYLLAPSPFVPDVPRLPDRVEPSPAVRERWGPFLDVPGIKLLIIPTADGGDAGFRCEYATDANLSFAILDESMLLDHQLINYTNSLRSLATSTPGRRGGRKGAVAEVQVDGATNRTS